MLLAQRMRGVSLRMRGVSLRCLGHPGVVPRREPTSDLGVWWSVWLAVSS